MSSFFRGVDGDVLRDVATFRDQLLEIARKRPDDEMAQFRAEAATEFCPLRILAADKSRVLGSSNADSTVPVKVQLPNELYSLIIEQALSFKQPDREHFLLRLAKVCRTLHALVEPHLYTHPVVSGMNTQYRFAFSMTITPRLAWLVQSMELHLMPKAANMAILIKICQVCPNLRDLTIRRWDGSGEHITPTHEDAGGLAFVLEACPGVTSFTYGTYPEGPEELHIGAADRAVILSNFQIDDRYVRFAAQLVSASFYGDAQWMLDLTRYQYRANLTSWVLGPDINMAINSGILKSLQRYCPLLERLEIHAPFGSKVREELETACEGWRSTLRALHIFGVMEDDEWVLRLIPRLQVLEELDLGQGCPVNHATIARFATLPQGFQSLSIGNVRDVNPAHSEFQSRSELRECVSKLVKAHSKTLESLEINSNMIDLDKILDDWTKGMEPGYSRACG